MSKGAFRLEGFALVATPIKLPLKSGVPIAQIFILERKTLLVINQFSLMLVQEFFS